MPDQQEKENFNGPTGTTSKSPEAQGKLRDDSTTNGSDLQVAQTGNHEAGAAREKGGLYSQSSSGSSNPGDLGVLVDKVKETANSAYDVSAEKATAKLTEHKTNLSAGLSTVADTVRQAGINIKEFVDKDGPVFLRRSSSVHTETAAQKLETLADYFEVKRLAGNGSRCVKTSCTSETRDIFWSRLWTWTSCRAISEELSYTRV